MKHKALEKLMTTPEMDHWLVVDTVRVPDIAQLAYQCEEAPAMQKLFVGTEHEHLLAQSPVAFRFTGSEEIAIQMVEDYALRTSCVLFSCERSLDEETLMAHLQALHDVYIDSAPLFFRYYGSPLWEEIVHQLTDEDIRTILGPCQSMSWTDSNQQFRTLHHPARMPEAVTQPYELISPVFKAWV
ncbi:DUF4123 domain-containing protein [Vibrio quintilis]|uniref:DUF4123 domain-containing protein n=1 Tax=Vibrio quintilis TaxID=1117707 RepID=A0A1M7YU28_9VIBR|nr:DUF4123 domain-containing protein [Vibrio quintilis]SHO56041.1 hypothetical protein VQ7734_01804 [Vibrio quintilis]